MALILRRQTPRWACLLHLLLPLALALLLLLHGQGLWPQQHLLRLLLPQQVLLLEQGRQL
jgi:hypothetical protein